MTVDLNSSPTRQKLAVAPPDDGVSRGLLNKFVSGEGVKLPRIVSHTL